MPPANSPSVGLSPSRPSRSSSSSLPSALPNLTHLLYSQDVPASFLLPPTNVTGRTTSSPLHHSLPAHPDILLDDGISVIQQLLSRSEGREDRQGGLDAGAAAGGLGEGGAAARTGGQASPNSAETYFIDLRRPQVGTDNPLSRRLPPFSQTVRNLSRQPYGSRPPQYRPGQQQDQYDWAPEPYPPAMFDSEEMLFSRLPMPDITTMSGPQFLARFQARNRQLQEEAESSSSSASATPVASNYQSLFADSINDTRPHPSTHIPSDRERSTAMWNRFSEHVRQRRDRDTAWLESLRSQYTDTQPRTRLRRSRRPERRPHPTGMDLDDPDMRDLSTILLYLSKLRSSRSRVESHRLLEKHIPSYAPTSPKPDANLFTDTRSLRIPESSFLQPGATFHGSQTTEPRRIPLPRPPPPSSTQNISDWRVKVRITSIDYATCALTGTMEAFGDWRLPSGEKRSISTYLEGELIDFRTHSLETLSFTSERVVDACYWSKLEPFSNLKTHAERKRALLSKRWIKEEVLGKYVLMRWKEREFIKDGKKGKGGGAGGEGEDGGEEQILTIRGFYFLSLRRKDGNVTGLYYDPESPPLQELLLEPGKAVGFPVFEMR